MALPHYLIRNANFSDISDILSLGRKGFNGNRFYMGFDEREVRYHLEYHPSICQIAVDRRGATVAFGLATNAHPVCRSQAQLAWFGSNPVAGRGSGLLLSKSIRSQIKSEFGINRAILDVDVNNQIVLNRIFKTKGAEIVATYYMISVPC